MDNQNMQFKVLRELLLESPEKQDRIFGEIAKLEKDYNHLLNKLKIIDEELPKLKQQLDAFSNPPLEHGVLLSGPKDEQVMVGVQGVRYNLSLAVPADQQAEIKPGVEALIQREGRAVLKILGKYKRGQSAEVLNVLDQVHPPIELEDGKKENNQECPKYPNDCKHYKRLHVRYANNEALVVETSKEIQDEEINIGDIVRADIRLAYAFEKMPSFEAGPLLLENDPDVRYEDIGGLDNQVQQIREAIEYPYLFRELFKEYHLQRPKGILLYGPPGCGKTMVAKAIATGLKNSIEKHWRGLLTAIQIYKNIKTDKIDTQLNESWLKLKDQNLSEKKSDNIEKEIELFLTKFKIPLDENKLPEMQSKIENYLEEGVKSYFLNVKGPELLDKYVGETEHKIRKVFDEAKRVATLNTPVVIFFDEMEAMFQTRGSGISSDVEKTIVPQLLAEMDGVEGMENVVVIGASNRADLIDPAILRPGRLGIKIKIDRPDRIGARQILKIYLLPEKQKANNSDDNRLKLGDQGLEKPITSKSEEVKHLKIARALLTKTLDILYSTKSNFHVTNKEGITQTLPLANFVSGAILNSIVSRAKMAALKRKINKNGDEGLISILDIREGIFEEFGENAEQMIRNVPEYTKQEFSVTVDIGERKYNKWDVPHPRPYQRETREDTPSESTERNHQMR